MMLVYQGLNPRLPAVRGLLDCNIEDALVGASSSWSARYMVKIMVEKIHVRFIRHPAVSRPARESYTFPLRPRHMSIGLARHRRKPNVYESWASSFAFTRRSVRFCASIQRGAQTPASIKIGVFPVENAMQPFYARDRDFFSAAGSPPTCRFSRKPVRLAAGIVSERSIVGYGAIDVLATLHSKSIPVTVIAPGGEYRSGTNTNVCGHHGAAKSTSRRRRISR